ncbi:unnamed protein product, partial [Dicrocoelium dendriticum]
DIINAVLLQVSELLHELPCEWNVQLNEHVLSDRCPVQWKRTNDENNDTSLTARTLSSVKIVHFNNPHKPDSLLSSWLLQNKYNAPNSGMRRMFMELHRFFKVYDGLVIKKLMLDSVRPECRRNNRCFIDTVSSFGRRFKVE